MKQNSGTQSLIEQINAVLNSKQWIAPPPFKKAEASEPQSGNDLLDFFLGGGDRLRSMMEERMVPIAELSDYGKAIYTLLDQKLELLNNKTTAYSTLKEGVPGDDTASISSSRFGNFGGMIQISIGMGRHNLTDFVTTDHTKLDELLAELIILDQEVNALKELKLLEMKAAFTPGKLANGHHMGLNENFQVMGCDCTTSYEKAHAKKFSRAIKQLMENYDVVLIPNNHATIGSYTDLLQELEAAHVTCKTGFIPGLQTETAKAIFMPKDLDAENMYQDKHLTSNIGNKVAANERKDRVQQLFNEIRQAGIAYVPEKETEPADVEHEEVK